MKTENEKELLRLRARLTKRFHKACADYGLIADGDHILIGLSGGKDSLALVELLGKRAQIYVPRFKVTAVHVRVKERDYHSDLSYLEDFCTRMRVPFIVKDTEIGGARFASGLENAASGYSLEVKGVDSEIKQEAVSALMMLGFAAAASGKVVDKILSANPNASVEQVIKQALKML